MITTHIRTHACARSLLLDEKCKESFLLLRFFSFLFRLLFFCFTWLQFVALPYNFYYFILLYRAALTSFFLLLFILLFQYRLQIESKNAYTCMYTCIHTYIHRNILMCAFALILELNRFSSFFFSIFPSFSFFL